MRLLQPPSQALYKLCEMRKITLSKFLNEQAPHEVEKKKDNGNKSSSQEKLEVDIALTERTISRISIFERRKSRLSRLKKTLPRIIKDDDVLENVRKKYERYRIVTDVKS